MQSESLSVDSSSPKEASPSGEDASQVQPHEGAPSQSFRALTLGSLGVVYGDIGTSPLYAFREAVLSATGRSPDVSVAAVYGVLSLILWALIIIVSLKYVVLLLRADNRGEGGTLSLMALAQRGLGRQSVFVLLLGIIAASLFYGDSILTPAVSVLSAVEGLELVTPAFSHYVVPLTLVILFVLFAVQHRGTASVAFIFGPIMLAWFALMGIAGLLSLVRMPGVLLAFNPLYGVEFLTHHGHLGFLTLGSVFLAVTGAEALYADLGHFGRKPIRVAWFAVVFPSLALNYLGQAVLVLRDPLTLKNPFFLLMPPWLLVPTLILAAVATVIASQAVLTGAFSLTRQAIQLGLLPRMRIFHTSESHAGQIYVRRMNWLIFIGVVLLTILFGSSSALTSAYGIAVTGTMVVTAILAFIVMQRCWKLPMWLAGLVILPFLAVDLTFLAANSVKVEEGGWFPVLLAAFLALVMWTWTKGAHLLFDKTRRAEIPLADLIRQLENKPPHRVSGTAVFLTGDPEGAPTALLHNLKHNKVLHERNIILTIRTADTPRIAKGSRMEVTPISDSFTSVMVTFGFAETPNIPRVLAAARKKGLSFDIMSTSFFMSRRMLLPSPRSGMPLWQDKLFIALAGTADSVSSYFNLPTDRVVEIGTQIKV
ncbi:KUP system potassium uptake protein [Faunimonas pinastri]|uniref:Probable potassium transport system protein Kup n=1 Tax=Faunimonas pinastri TaxID=1855383 RepID=A0A1H8Z9M0_9HYPH|nr:potassium transporter Kup [Faunimonas pinastri]SEP61031.1 KUP system potassium uptake protein [Faunimonas pinastri]